MLKVGRRHPPPAPGSGLESTPAFSCELERCSREKEEHKRQASHHLFHDKAVHLGSAYVCFGHPSSGPQRHGCQQTLPSFARKSATGTRTGSSKAFCRVSFHAQACPVRGCSFAAAFISGNSSSANLLVSCDTTGAVVGTHGHPLFHKRIAFGGGQARMSAATLLRDVRPCVGSSIYFGFADHLWSRRTPMRLRDSPSCCVWKCKPDWSKGKPNGGRGFSLPSKYLHNDRDFCAYSSAFNNIWTNHLNMVYVFSNFEALVGVSFHYISPNEFF